MNTTYIKWPRWIHEDLQAGKLTHREFLVLNVLWLMADHRTGGDYVNAPLLLWMLGIDRTFGKGESGEGDRTFGHTPEGAIQAARRVLKSLHRKGYIWYVPCQGTPKKQPYWLHGYPIEIKETCMFIDLTHLLEKSTVSQADIESRVSVTASVTASVAASNYKNSITQEFKKKTNIEDSTRGTPRIDSTNCDETLKDLPIGVKADPLVAINESVVTNRTETAEPEAAAGPVVKRRTREQLQRLAKGMGKSIEDAITALQQNGTVVEIIN